MVQPTPEESTNSAAAAAGGGGGAGKALTLEQQPVELSADLRFVWHRPPLEVVERQWRDPSAVRIFVNGCFDLMHVGHFNALRQAKSLFYQKGYKEVVLVAGLHSDSAIEGQKGPPLLTEEERVEVLQASKWVDELATDLPYVSMSAKMADALRVHWICHGDDLPICRTGGGMYSDAIDKGRFQLLKRTEGISTTQILERLLCQPSGDSEASAAGATAGGGAGNPAGECAALAFALATTQRLAQFAAPADPRTRARSLSEASRVVYVSGTFDLLHQGHIQLLQQAALLGDYLLVGVCSDETVRQHRGAAPVLTLHERAMAVLSLRVVDDVVLGAPWEVSQDLLTTMNVSVVATSRRGRKRPRAEACASEDTAGGEQVDSRLAAPRAGGLLAEVDVRASLSVAGIRRRFAARRQQIAERNGTLMKKELAYVKEKRYVPEA